MKSIFEYINQKQKSFDLVDFDKSIYDSIPMDDQFRLPDSLINDPDTKLFTIKINGQIAGVTGFIKKKNRYYFQIAILPKFRGMNILNKSVNFLKEKYKIKQLISVIEKDNIASIKAHEKNGFQRNNQLEKELWSNKKYVYISE